MPSSKSVSMVSLVLAVLTLAACAAPQPRLSEPRAFQWSEHPGVWISSGYGYLVDARREKARLYHVVNDVCVENPAGGITVLDFFGLYRQDDASTLRLFSALDPYPHRFQKIGALPDSCTPPTANTQLDTFDAFVAYFAAHYAFFDLYGVDWAERTAQARRQLTAEIGDKALFELMSELLRPLKDSHIKIEAIAGGEKLVYDGNPGKTDLAVAAWAERTGIGQREAIMQFRRAYWLDDIRDTVLAGNGVLAANGRVQYGMAAEGVGYVAVVSMGGFVNGEGDTAYQELGVLDAAMDEALALFDDRQAQAVIVDLSLNTGGYDFVGLALAGRFAADRQLAYTRRAGDDPAADDFEIHVEPSEGRRFTGPVYVLTSDLTKSAAEIGTLALRALPNVTHLGERTRGAFSTVLTKHLPNGWVLSLSNEIYTDPAGVVWEGKGIEPQRTISVFDQQNPLAGHAEAVRKVVELIGTQP